MQRAETTAMDRDGTNERGEADTTGRALMVVHSQDDGNEPARHLSGGRPMASFLAQLIVDTDPALRVARLERTRAAAALYARAAGVPGKRCA